MTITSPPTGGGIRWRGVGAANILQLLYMAEAGALAPASLDRQLPADAPCLTLLGVKRLHPTPDRAFVLVQATPVATGAEDPKIDVVQPLKRIARLLLAGMSHDRIS